MDGIHSRAASSISGNLITLFCCAHMQFFYDNSSDVGGPQAQRERALVAIQSRSYAVLACNFFYSYIPKFIPIHTIENNLTRYTYTRY